MTLERFCENALKNAYPYGPYGQPKRILVYDPKNHGTIRLCEFTNWDNGSQFWTISKHIGPSCNAYDQCLPTMPEHGWTLSRAPGFFNPKTQVYWTPVEPGSPERNVVDVAKEKWSRKQNHLMYAFRHGYIDANEWYAECKASDKEYENALAGR